MPATETATIDDSATATKSYYEVVAYDYEGRDQSARVIAASPEEAIAIWARWFTWKHPIELFDWDEDDADEGGYLEVLLLPPIGPDTPTGIAEFESVMIFGDDFSKDRKGDGERLRAIIDAAVYRGELDCSGWE